MALTRGILLGMGNPLLDISAECDTSFLDTYGMKPNDAILAEDKHLPMYDQMKKMDIVEFTAGGATQNSMRICQWILGKPETVGFMGCVGKDDNAKILKEKLAAEGVLVKYQENEKEPTGTCAVVITGGGKFRSLCANLGAANCFTVDHINVPEHWAIVENAKFYYIAGFFLTVSPDTILKVAHHACEHDKPFCMNLAAPFISQFFRERLLAAFPCIDVLFGNEVEYETFAKEENMGTTDLVEIGKRISAYPKQGSRKRLVIITQGENPVICVQGENVTTFDVPKLLPDQIVDTNGAGDAFVGGFLSKYILGKELSECVDCGVWASHQIIERPGATFPPECTYKGNYLKN